MRLAQKRTPEGLSRHIGKHPQRRICSRQNVERARLDQIGGEDGHSRDTGTDDSGAERDRRLNENAM